MGKNKYIGMSWDDYENEYMSKEERKELKAKSDFMIKLIDLRNKEITQKELSEKAKIAQSVISRIETGRTSPKLDTIIKMLAAIDCELEIVPIAKK